MTLVLIGVAVMTVAMGAPATRGPAYEAYQIGDFDAPRPAATQAGLMLMGGGEWADDAFHWLTQHAGHGHMLILRASGGADLQEQLYRQIGGVASVQTLVFRDRKAASDPQVLAAIRHADGIFIAGGDQSNYIRYWKGTPVAEALDQHVRDGKPLGGTSAGLAILGAHVYGAMDGGSVTSRKALANPAGKHITLVGDFLHMPYLDRVITDSHFGKRDRLGRLLVFLAMLDQPGTYGIGVDENTALCIEADGMARVFSDSHGRAWLAQPQQSVAAMRKGRPLNWRDVWVTGVDAGSRFDVKNFEVERPAFAWRVDVEQGVLVQNER